MSVILVVETDASYAQRLDEALRPTGLPVEVYDSAPDALSAAAVRPPRLVIASSAVPDVRNLLGRFARGQGGPGAVAMIPMTLVGRVGAGDYQADALLPKPFTAAEAREVLTPLLSSKPEPRRPLSSADIFGDVLAEVEGTASPRPASRQDDDLERKLEETLSGVLPAAGSRKRSPTAAAGETDGATEIDALLDKTLSSLELPTRKKKRALRPPEPPAREERREEHEEHEEHEEAPLFEPPPPLEELPPITADEVPVEPVLEVDEPVLEVDEPVLEVEVPVLEVEVPASEDEVPVFDPEPVFDPGSEIPEMPDAFRTQRMEIVAQRETIEGETFGDYTLIRRIAVGGMAEVWQARRRGVEGFQKSVAIKKILSHLTGSPDFVTMFIDEAKLAAQLNHANISQIYDLGKVGDDFYIAMELVDGMDLRTILSAARKKGRPLPMGLALLIAGSVARALDYAHRKRDFDNRELGLVHRDVSPQNVLISNEGEIKLCDFGIVKAVAKASTTQMGALKGKLQYMSPEQAWGKSVDARSDIFSLGAVLFEMLTGTRLFSGDSEIGVLDAVRECRIPSARGLVPEIPEEVDRILRRALAQRPEERYPTAGDMEADLKDALHRFQPLPSPSDLAAYLASLAATPEPAKTPVDARPAPAPAAPASATVGSAADEPVEEVAVVEGTAEEPSADIVPAPRGRPLVRLLVAAVVAALLGAATLFLVQRSRDDRSVTRPAEATAEPVAAEPVAAPPVVAPPAAPEIEGGAEAAAAVDIQEIVDQEMARRAEELRQEFEAKKRRLEKELEEARAAAEAPPVDEEDDPSGDG